MTSFTLAFAAAGIQASRYEDLRVTLAGSKDKEQAVIREVQQPPKPKTQTWKPANQQTREEREKHCFIFGQDDHTDRYCPFK